MSQKEIIGSYKELKGVLDSIPEESWFYDKGFTEHANRVISRIGVVCEDLQDINEYLLPRDSFPDGRAIVNSIPTKQKVKSLLGRIEGLYELSENLPSTGNTFIQNQTQTQFQHLTVILELQERIIGEIPKYKEGTKERNFLEKLKNSLPTLGSTIEILATVLKVGGELGIDPLTIHKLLGL